MHDKPPVLHRYFAQIQLLGKVGDIRQILCILRARLDIPGMGHANRQQILIHSLRNRLHGGGNDLLREVSDVQRHLLGGDCHGHIPKAIHLDRNAALGDILGGGGSGEILRYKLGRLADGDGITDIDKFIRIVPVYQIRHNQIALQHHKCFLCYDLRGQKSVCHNLHFSFTDLFFPAGKLGTQP